MFEGSGCSPDPLHVVSKVWEIHLDGESKKTQLYADAHVKVSPATCHALDAYAVRLKTYFAVQERQGTFF